VNSTIILDCQTGAATPYCEDCIARKTCKIRKELKRQKVADVTTKLVELAVAVPAVLAKK
jgi:hypothetical protein